MWYCRLCYSRTGGGGLLGRVGWCEGWDFDCSTLTTTTPAAYLIFRRKTDTTRLSAEPFSAGAANGLTAVSYLKLNALPPRRQPVRWESASAVLCSGKRRRPHHINRRQLQLLWISQLHWIGQLWRFIFLCHMMKMKMNRQSWPGDPFGTSELCLLKCFYFCVLIYFFFFYSCCRI